MTLNAPGRALLTDRYELTMLDGLLAAGRAEQPAVFTSFARNLPRGRRYGVLGGVGRLLPLITEMRFDAEELAWLQHIGAIREPTARWLRDWHFAGDIDGYREGEPYVAGSPLFTVRAPLGQAILLETLALSVLNHDSAVAAAAARMHSAAQGRGLVEMGARRTHEQAAVDSARAAFICGFDTTSDLAAGARYGVPTAGTAAHAFVLAFDTEREAFAAQLAAQGPGTTLLVDTFDIDQGIRTAVELAGPALGAIRIDSGPMAEGARRARALLDSLGAPHTRIVLTGDLDEFVISELAAAPADAYGVGTRLSTGSGQPTAGLVYKLVSIGDPPRPVAKASAGKTDPPGARRAWRRMHDGHAVAEVIVPEAVSLDPPSGEVRALAVALMRGGQIVHAPALDSIRAHHLGARSELPPDALLLSPGPAALPAVDH